MPESRISISDGLPALYINGEKIMPCGYMTYQAEQGRYAAFARQGCRLLFVPLYAGDRGINPFSGIKPFYRGFWTGDGEYDFSDADKVLRLAAAGREPGEIWLIPRVMLEPPRFWERAHPGELCRDAAGEDMHQSYSSDV